MVAWLQYWFPLECKCVFSLSCPTVADFLLFCFIFQIWIKMSSHQFSSHLPQPSSTLFPFFCLWPFISFSPISPCPFTLLSSCCHCASENVASYSSSTSLESQEWDPQGVESLAQRRRGIALGYSGPLAVLPGPTFCCLLIHEPLYTQGLGQVRPPEQSRGCFTWPRAAITSARAIGVLSDSDLIVAEAGFSILHPQRVSPLLIYS